MVMQKINVLHILVLLEDGVNFDSPSLPKNVPVTVKNTVAGTVIQYLVQQPNGNTRLKNYHL